MKMIVHEPICVAQGPTYEEVSWGPWQFPGIYEDEYGNIYVSVGIGQDNECERGKDCAWFISHDRGDTWKSITPENAAISYRLLPNGDRLMAYVPPLHVIPEEAYSDAEPIDILHDWTDIYIYI